jgi:hypothetical protein
MAIAHRCDRWRSYIKAKLGGCLPPPPPPPPAVFVFLRPSNIPRAISVPDVRPEVVAGSVVV